MDAALSQILGSKEPLRLDRMARQKIIREAGVGSKPLTSSEAARILRSMIQRTHGFSKAGRWSRFFGGTDAVLKNRVLDEFVRLHENTLKNLQKKGAIKNWNGLKGIRNAASLREKAKALMKFGVKMVLMDSVLVSLGFAPIYVADINPLRWSRLPANLIADLRLGKLDCAVCKMRGMAGLGARLQSCARTLRAASLSLMLISLVYYGSIINTMAQDARAAQSSELSQFEKNLFGNFDSPKKLDSNLVTQKLLQWLRSEEGRVASPAETQKKRQELLMLEELIF